MKYEVQIANKVKYLSGSLDFSMLKMTDDLDRAFDSFNKAKAGEFGPALVVRIINVDNELVIIQTPLWNCK